MDRVFLKTLKKWRPGSVLCRGSTSDRCGLYGLSAGADLSSPRSAHPHAHTYTSVKVITSSSSSSSSSSFHHHHHYNSTVYSNWSFQFLFCWSIFLHINSRYFRFIIIVIKSAPRKSQPDGAIEISLLFYYNCCFWFLFNRSTVPEM